MIRFASQKNWSMLNNLPKVFRLVVIVALLKLPLLGQENPDYRGVWQTETPDNGNLVLIVKCNNLASYFWADNADRTVYQGSWGSDADSVTLKWEDDSTHRIERNLLGYTITHFDAAEAILYSAPVKRLPEEILGQWAKAPSDPEDQISDLAKSSGFFGTWEIEDETNTYYLIVEPDRTAAISWTQNDTHKNGLRGLWAKQGSELHIAWDTGYYSILKQNERSFVFELIAPGNIIEKSNPEELTATRINEDLLPDEWQNLRIDEKTSQAGDRIFANRADAISFYRGSWIVQLAEDTFERIEIGRFGGLKTSADDTLYGNWSMSGQDIFMSWDDGIREILKSVGNGFLIYEYKPGRPMDGVPTRIFSAAPENVSKLAKYMEGQKEVAIALLDHVKSTGFTAASKDSGWGQELVNWAWPFGDSSEDVPLANAHTPSDTQSSKRIDPWWWPLWSENPSIETTAFDSEHYSAETLKDSETVDKTKPNKPAQPNWDWPF